jgi:spore germination protein GerM
MTLTRREIVVYTTLSAVLGLALVVLVVVAPRWLATPASDTPPDVAESDPRKIRVRLFYVAENGMRLVPLEQEVLFGEATDEQAKRIVEAQLAAPSAPLASAIPPGTKLRSLFLTAKGEAFVDLSAEAKSAHPGGTTNELFAVYAIVNALTVNLPAISGVQILIDGKEADTLAGHLDLRRPLGQDLRWVADQ